MGFFKKLFKRKKGGTFFGNVLRGVTNKASGGILGNGDDLRRFEEKQAMKEAAAKQVAVSKIQQKKGVKDIIKETLGEEIPKTDEGKELISDAKKKYLKENWWKILLILAGFTILVVWLTKKFSGNKKKPRRMSY